MIFVFFVALAVADAAIAVAVAGVGSAKLGDNMAAPSMAAVMMNCLIRTSPLAALPKCHHLCRRGRQASLYLAIGQPVLTPGSFARPPPIAKRDCSSGELHVTGLA